MGQSMARTGVPTSDPMGVSPLPFELEGHKGGWWVIRGQRGERATISVATPPLRGQGGQRLAKLAGVRLGCFLIDGGRGGLPAVIDPPDVRV